MLALAPGSSGKSTAIITMITDKRFYRGAWEHVYWCSPTATVDDALDPLRDYVKELDQDQAEDPTFHDSLDVPFLTKVIARQKRVTEWMKKQNPRPKKGFGCLIVLDDLADSRGSPAATALVDSLFVKARHWGVSTILVSQKLRLPLITQTVRVNLTCAMIWRLRNQSDLWDGFLYEYSALVDKKTLHEIYQDAVSEPFNFLFVNLLAKDTDHMFYSGFDKRYVISDM